MQRLAEVARAAIVVEGDYPDLFRTQRDRGSWLADMLARVPVRCPRFRSSSLDRGGSPRNGLSASSELLLPTARDLLNRQTQPRPLFERKLRTFDVISHRTDAVCEARDQVGLVDALELQAGLAAEQESPKEAAQAN